MLGKLVFVALPDGGFYGAKVIREYTDRVAVETYYAPFFVDVVDKRLVMLQDGE